MIRLVNGNPLPPTCPRMLERRKAQAELYKKHRYGGSDQAAAWELMMDDMARGTYDAHCAEWVNMLKLANLFDNRP